jgi:general secretion pathway protein K
MKKHCRYLTDNRGVALMLVLWVMVFLTIIVTEFAFSMRTEVNITRNFKEETQSYYLARAGIALALAEILATEAQGVYMENGELVFKQTVEGGEEQETALTPQRQDIPLGPGSVSYQIIDEEAKINLNSLMAGGESQRQVLHRLLYEGAGIQMGTERDIIVDSILDWMDKDDLHKLNGAEDDYYHSLDPPYDCKDGPFDTVDELLLVRGMTKEILYGTGDRSKAEEEAEKSKSYPGIAKFLTVWSGGRFNNYTADATTLKIKYGEEKGQSIAEDIAERLRNPDFTPPKSFCYSIISTGKLGDGSISRSIFAVVKIKHKDGMPNIEYRCWNDNLVKYQFITAGIPDEGEEEGSSW